MKRRSKPRPDVEPPDRTAAGSAAAGLSIVVPAHDEARWIGPCLAAIIAEVGRDAASRPVAQPDAVEIIVVDNASRDDTAAIALGYVDAAARVGATLRVLSEPTKGLTRARQRGHDAARGTIVAWVDADTRMPPGWLRRVRAIFARSPRVVCASGPYRYADLTRAKRWLVGAYWWLIAAPTYRLTGYLAVGGNFAVRRDAVTRIGGFDTSIAFFGEDTNIARRLAAVGDVVFDLALVMPTSSRRLDAEGFATTALRYVGNFVSEVVRKRPLDTPYRDVR